MNQEEIIIKGDNCDTGRTWGRDYLFLFLRKTTRKTRRKILPSVLGIAPARGKCYKKHSMHFPSENKEDYLMGTVVTGAVVVVIVGLIIRSMVRDKKNGKSLQCGGDCGKCGGHCH